MNLNKFIIILIGFFDILAIGIFIPTLPDLAIFYDVSANQISYALVAYAFFHFYHDLFYDNYLISLVGKKLFFSVL